ncbi:hypothetical protein [Nocardioides dubius]
MAPHRSPVGNADGASAFPDTVEEIATALRKDPILVEELMGNGQTEALRAALREKAELVDVPVYVVLTKPPASMSGDDGVEELSLLLQQELGDGVYYVATPRSGNELRVAGDVLPQEGSDYYTLLGALQDAQQIVWKQALGACAECHSHPGADAGLVLDLVAAAEAQPGQEPSLGQSQTAAYLGDPWVHREVETVWDDTPSDLEPSVGLSALVATGTALVTTVIAYRLIQALRYRPPADKSQARHAALADQAITNAEAKAERRKLSSELESEVLDLLARARTLRTSDDGLDLVGAVVLARMAERLATSQGSQRYRACYVNPLHGEATTAMALGGGLEVPVCRGCRKRHEVGHPRDPLLERRSFGRRRAYYDGQSLWAASGYGALDDDFWQKVGR